MPSFSKTAVEGEKVEQLGYAIDGPVAHFRTGQWGRVKMIIKNQHLLAVQKTSLWKSMSYL